MHNGMKLEDMLAEVVRHNSTKRDFIVGTKENLAMVSMPPELDGNEKVTRFADGVALVVQKDGASNVAPVLERFDITDNCHKQIAARLKIPQRYYHRLLHDHRDMVMMNVNELFAREPELRMVRTLDGRARAFLSNSFRRVDNEQILERTLPVIKNEFDTTLLNTHVDENSLRLKCLFTGDEHSTVVPTNGRAGERTVHTGFEMGNSEVGKGSFFIRGFIYDGYCTNGCVWGTQETAQFKQIHVGSRLGMTESMLLSNETMRKEDDLIVSAGRDILKHFASPEFTAEIGQRLRALAATENVKSAQAACEHICEELSLSENESASMLETFIRDQDYSQWGMVSAVTSLANTTDEYQRSCELEKAGNNIINLNFRQWNTIAQMEKVAVAA